MDATGKVVATVRAGMTAHDLEVSAYKSQYAYNGFLSGFREAVAGSTAATLNQLGGLTNTPNQINSPFRIIDHREINVSLIKSMMESAIANKKVY